MRLPIRLVVVAATAFSLVGLVGENSLAGSRMNSALFVPYRVIENDTFFVTVE